MAKYLVNWQLDTGKRKLEANETVELSDADIKALGLNGSGVLTKIADKAPADKAADKAPAGGAK